jgi:ABC-type branched-subunit amino acid transport system ATPase component
MEFALRLADYCYIMEKGAIIFEGAVAKLSREEIRERLAI